MTDFARALFAALMIVALVVFAACSEEGTVTGEAGDPADVDEIVEITTSDQLRFTPDAIEVDAGQTIEFRITNAATGEHEFVLGPAHDHEAGMQHSGPTSTGTTAPGKIATVYWTFPEAGTVTFACYIAGHNEQGMTGTINVSG